MTKEINRLRELAGINRGDKFILNEIFDNPYPYAMSRLTRCVRHVNFESDDGDNIRVNFMVDDLRNDTVNVNFSKNGDYDITGQKDQFRIFATVLNIMKDFMEDNYNVKKLWFSADEKSRISLYRRMLTRFAGENDFDFKENKYDGLYTIFTLRRKD